MPPDDTARDRVGRLRTRLLGRPSPAERAARDVARRELEEADVDLTAWRRAREGARDDAHARERYAALRAAALRAAALRHVLDAEVRPLLDADLDNRSRQSAAFIREADARWATPDGEAAHRDACGEAVRGTAVLTGLYYGVALLLVALGVGLGSCGAG